MHKQLTKWMKYQKERFPLGKYSLLVAAFSASGLSLSYLLTNARHPLTAQMFIVAFITTFLIFFQLRVADEHKDFEFDAKYHPERPVPRGLVSLRELRVLAGVSAFVQLALCLSLNPVLLFPLAAAWLYMWLMTVEFFAGDWLRKHPILYMLSHMCILFFTDLFITSCHFMVSNVVPPPALAYFLATSFCLGVVIELGRKIKSPQDETNAGDTYSHLWGHQAAVKIWLTAIAASFLFAILTAAQINAEGNALIVLLVLFGLCKTTGKMFVMKPSTWAARKIDNLSGTWALATYLVLGLIPLVLYRFFS